MNIKRQQPCVNLSDYAWTVLYSLSRNAGLTPQGYLHLVLNEKLDWSNNTGSDKHACAIPTHSH